MHAYKVSFQDDMPFHSSSESTASGRLLLVKGSTERFARRNIRRDLTISSLAGLIQRSGCECNYN